MRPILLMFLVLAAALSAASGALAQQAPRVYDAQVTTSPSEILPTNPSRNAANFCNSSLTINVGICPAVSGRTGSPITCAFQGRGSITIPPTWCRSIAAPDRSGKLPSAWNGVAESGTVNITIIETE